MERSYSAKWEKYQSKGDRQMTTTIADIADGKWKIRSTYDAKTAFISWWATHNNERLRRTQVKCDPIKCDNELGFYFPLTYGTHGFCVRASDGRVNPS